MERLEPGTCLALRQSPDLLQRSDQLTIRLPLRYGLSGSLTMRDRRTRGLASMHPATAVLHGWVFAWFPAPALGSALGMERQRLPCLVHRLVHHF